MAEKKGTTKKGASRAKGAPKEKKKKSPSESKIARLEEKVRALETASAELEERYLRLRAEFDNYRKRKEREILRLLEYRGEDIIKSFLPVIDDIERMVESVDGKDVPTVRSLVEGMQLILEKLRRKLTAQGVKSFDSVGEVFDPELHDALMIQESKDHEENVVIQEFEKGYRFKDKVIRHAKVVVNSLSGGDET